MTAFSDYLEDEIGDITLNGGTYVGGAVYFAMFTTNPTDDGSGTEVSDSGYARKQAHTTLPSDGFTDNGNGVFTNAKIVSFDAIIDTQITVTHWGLFDAVSGGNLLYHGVLTASKTLDPTDVLSYPIGSCTVTLA